MRNINELVGIIRGISFDGVVNEKEIEYLQKWVDSNRELVHDSVQKKMIALVDKVLEDNIVTDDERHDLLQVCDEISENSLDTTLRLYELNGIISGIISDNVVNEAEVRKMKKWLDENTEYLRGRKNIDKLIMEIDKILEDNIVTIEEQLELLNILRKGISGSQFENKIEHLERKVMHHKNIGIDLIDILDDDDALSEIHNRAEEELWTALYSYTGSFFRNREIVFISLVLIAMLNYDGNYYDHVRNTYTNIYSRFSEQKIEGLIRSVLRRYLPENYSRTGKSRIINVVLQNSIVPKKFLPSFFDFIYDIYKINFLYELPEDLKEDFSFIYDGLKKVMLSNSDEINIDATRKTYKLIKTTKELITSETELESIINLSIIIVKLIDQAAWNNPVIISNDYINYGYREWIKNAVFEGETANGRKKSDFRSRWKSKFYFKNNRIFLIPPIHKVKSDYDYRSIKVNVFNGPELIYENIAPDIREIIGGYQVIVKEIELKDPLNNVNYVLYAGDEIIYDSKKELYRKYIVFDEKGNELKNNTDYSGIAVVCSNEEIAEAEQFFVWNQYRLSEVSVDIGDYVIINNEVFHFTSLTKPGVIGERLDNYYVKKYDTEEEIPVFSSIKYLQFESDIESSNFLIIINDSIQKLDDMAYKETERMDIKKYLVDLSFLSSGIYDIKVQTIEHGRRKNIINCKAAVDRDITVDCQKINDKVYFVSVGSELAGESITVKLEVESFSENWYIFDHNHEKFVYLIPLDLDFYRIDGVWKSIEEYLWIGNIVPDSVLELYSSNIDEVEVLSDKNKIIEKIENAVFDLKKINIGFLLSFKNEYDYTELNFRRKGSAVCKIRCYNKCVIDRNSTDISFDPIAKELLIKTSYYGNGRVFYKISEEGNAVFQSEFLENGGITKVENIKSFKKYNIAFYEKERGLSLKKERILYENNMIFYARADMEGRSFKITDVYYDMSEYGKLFRKHQYFFDSFVRIKEQINDDTFNGELFIRNKSKIYVYSKINPVEIQVCSDVNDGMMELSITKDGDGLLLDNRFHRIMNTMDDPNAVDIFSYMIKMNGAE